MIGWPWPFAAGLVTLELQRWRRLERMIYVINKRNNRRHEGRPASACASMPEGRRVRAVPGAIMSARPYYDIINIGAAAAVSLRAEANRHRGMSRNAALAMSSAGGILAKPDIAAVVRLVVFESRLKSACRNEGNIDLEKGGEVMNGRAHHRPSARSRGARAAADDFSQIMSIMSPAPSASRASCRRRMPGTSPPMAAAVSCFEIYRHRRGAAACAYSASRKKSAALLLGIVIAC